MRSLLLYIQKKNLEWLILVVLVIPSFFSLLRPGFYPMHDDLQAFRVHQMDKCIQDLQIPCRWVPDMGYQYGYPQYNYYPPSIYYLAEAFHLLGFQFIDTIKIVVALGFILSAVFMYLFLKSWLGAWPGFVGAILYTYIPYKAVNVYVRGALNEFWAAVFFPLLFWSALRLVKYKEKKDIVFFALSVALLLITHNLMTLIFIPIILVWVLLLLTFDKRWKVALKFILGGILGFFLAAFFTLPVTFEKEYVHLETIIGGYFDYRQHFANLNQLFITNFFDYGSSQWKDGDGLSLSAGHVQWIGSLFAVIFALFLYKKEKQKAIFTLVLGLLALLNLFMIHQKSSFIWSMFDFLKWLQFPWRFLSNVTFLLSILSAVFIYFLIKIPGKINYSLVMGILLIVSALLLYGSFFQPREWYDITDKEKFSGEAWNKQLTVSIFDYLPIYAKFPPITPASNLPETLEGNIVFKDYKKGSNYQQGTAEVTGSTGLVRLPLFDFPGMEVKIDGEKVHHWNNDCRNQEFCLGLITFEIPEGTHKLETKLTNTPIRTVGNILTTLGLIISCIIIFKGKNAFFKK
jgi:hypothetical protein